MEESDDNNIGSNNVTQVVTPGIVLSASNNNFIHHNSLKNNIVGGLLLVYSNNTQIVGNNVYECGDGINLGVSSNSNTIAGNHIEDTTIGIFLLDKNNNNYINGNVIKNSRIGIDLLFENNGNRISNNVLLDNYPVAIDVGGSEAKGMKIVDPDKIIGNIDGNSIYGNSIGLSNDQEDSYAVCLFQSSGVQVYNNTIAHYQICFRVTNCTNDKFYNNKIFSRDDPIVVYEHANTGIAWDNGYPIGGNYWSNYEAIDDYSGAKQDQLGGDGIFDDPYDITAYDSIYRKKQVTLADGFPLSSFSAKPTIATISVNGEEQVVTIVTSSTVLQVAAVSDTLKFTVTGEDGKKGYARITCPKTNTTALRVYIDGKPLASSITSDDSYYYVCVEYHLSTHEISIPFTKPTQLVPSVVKFVFDRVGKPSELVKNSTDTRDLAVAFDWVEFLDGSNTTLTKIDIGSTDAKQYLTSGWYDNPGSWGEAANYAWSGGPGKIAVLNIPEPVNAEYILFRARPFMSNNTLRVTLNDETMLTVTPTQGWAEYKLKISTGVPKLTLYDPQITGLTASINGFTVPVNAGAYYQ